MKIKALRDRPAHEPRTGALHIDPQLVAKIVAMVMAKIPRAKNPKEVITNGMKSIQISLRLKDAVKVTHVLRVVIKQGRPDTPSVTGLLRGDALYVYLPPLPSVSEKWLAANITSILTHEMAHVRDPAVWTPHGQAESTENLPPAEYVNHPMEVRARLSEVLQQLRTKAAMDGIKPSMKPTTWAKKYSETWEDILPYVSTQTKHKFLQMIFEAYRAAMAAKYPAKAKPKPGRALASASFLTEPYMSHTKKIIETLKQARDAIQAAVDLPASTVVSANFALRHAVAEQLIDLANEKAHDAFMDSVLRTAAYDLTDKSVKNDRALMKAWRAVSTYQSMVTKLKFSSPLLRLLSRLTAQLSDAQKTERGEDVEKMPAEDEPIKADAEKKHKKKHDMQALLGLGGYRGSPFLAEESGEGEAEPEESAAEEEEAPAAPAPAAAPVAADLDLEAAGLPELDEENLPNINDMDAMEALQPEDDSDWAGEATPEDILKYTLGIKPKKEAGVPETKPLRPKPTEMKGMDLLSSSAKKIRKN